MLDRCFIHLPGIGLKFTEKLRAAGILTWDDALCNPLPGNPRRVANLKAGVAASKERLAAGDFRWFSEALPAAEQWRLFPHCRGNAAYVDIETTTLAWRAGCVTTIAFYDGSRVRTYVQGRNLEAFADDVRDCDLLVTWNGRGFDAPILRRTLNIPLDMPHLDLLPVFRKFDLRGGLKRVEKALGLDREALNGVDGRTAVWLWNAFERSGDEAFLRTLLAYNVADVLSLEYLAAYAVSRNTGLTMEEVGVTRVNDCNPFEPDPAVLRRLGLLPPRTPLER